MNQPLRFFLCCLLLVPSFAGAGEPAKKAAPSGSDSNQINVLFVGNSYTGRHHLASIVKQLAEAGDPGLTFNSVQVIYGGRTLEDHWRLGTQHIVNQYQVSTDQVSATIDKLKISVKENPDDQHAAHGLQRMQALLKSLENGDAHRTRWDWVVLQSYRDDLDGDDSLYMQFAPKFAEYAKSQNARVLLYETTPTTQNQFPIAQHPDPTDTIEKSKSIARLTRQIDAKVAPMSYVAMRCQHGNCELPLRFINDAHLNQNMAYLTACTIYAAMFERSPQGLPVNSVTDIRFWKNDATTGKDRDGNPITKVFSDEEREFLQTTAWKALQDFNAGS